MIVALLHSDILDAVNDRRSGTLSTPFPGTVNVATEYITDPVFDIVDVKGIGGSIKRQPNSGTATYINGDFHHTYDLCFIQYEAYLNQFNLPQGDWARGLSRVDFIVYTPLASDYLILHELSEGAIGSKRHKAVIQILNTLRFLTSIPSVKSYITSFKNKLCYVSAKGCVDTTSPKGIADGFMAIYNALPDPVPVRNQSIERMGFNAYASNILKIK